MGTKPICLPFASEAQYREYVDHPAQYRQYLREMLRQYPALFPHDMAQGFTFHDAYVSLKQHVIVRRIKLKATGAVFTIRPSFVMPYMIARTDEVEKALYLQQWGVPFDALAYVFGRDAMFWYRAWPYGPWRCNGTFTPLAHACGGTSRRGWLPFTTSTAFSITQTGCIIS